MRKPEFSQKDAPLKADVSFVGGLIGDIIGEQEGEAFFELVETARTAAIARRRGDGAAQAKLKRIIHGLSGAQHMLFARAFTAWFYAVNLAEQTHRIRRLREQAYSDVPVEGSLLQAAYGLKANDVAFTDLQAAIKQLQIRPVFTAHPTQASRKALLQAQRRLLKLMAERIHTDLTPEEDAANRASIRDALTIAWQTDAVVQTRPTVEDEREHILFYLTEVLYRVIPPYYERLRHAIESAWGDEARNNFRLSPIVGFGSWVGGDMDGNPNVKPESFLGALAEHRERILRMYLRDILKLSRTLTQSGHHANVSGQVESRIQRYEDMFPLAAEKIPQRHRDMPYRILCQLIHARLRATLKSREGAYRTASEFCADLLAIRESLRKHRGRHAGMFTVNRLLMKARCFGFHLACLDMRCNSADFRQAIAVGLDQPDFPQLSPEVRTELVQKALQDAQPIEKPTGKLHPTLAVFRAWKQAFDDYGERALGVFILSMTQNADDVLGILLLARWAGCVDDNGQVPMDVVPLFETLEDLQQATATMQDCLKHPDYRQHVRAREDKQMVMLGYSDSNKDAGIVASRAALLSAQESLDETCRHQGVSLSLFHGRGGSISRGGGSLHKAVEATPISAASGVLRVTEQGEAIEQKFSARGIALRNLEQVSSATLEILLKRDHGDAVPQRWRNILACMAQGAEQRYRELMADSRLVPYFRHATPIDVIERLYIGSRPSKRVKDGDLGSLRAIPWVFSWGQSRHGLPGWFGMNAGIQKAMDNFDLTDIRDAISNWPFLQGIFDDVQMVMAKSDIRIAGRYAELAPDDVGTLYTQIEADFMDTESQFGTLQLAPLSETDPTLHRAIALRNPYIDPMSFLQVELLDQWRASDRKDDDLYAALVQTVQGIAAGLKNTG